MGGIREAGPAGFATLTGYDPGAGTQDTPPLQPGAREGTHESSTCGRGGDDGNTVGKYPGLAEGLIDRARTHQPGGKWTQRSVQEPYGHGGNHRNRQSAAERAEQANTEVDEKRDATETGVGESQRPSGQGTNDVQGHQQCGGAEDDRGNPFHRAPLVF